MNVQIGTVSGIGAIVTKFGIAGIQFYQLFFYGSLQNNILLEVLHLLQRKVMF